MVVWLYQAFVSAKEFIKTVCSVYCQQATSACLSLVPGLFFLSKSAGLEAVQISTINLHI